MLCAHTHGLGNFFAIFPHLALLSILVSCFQAFACFRVSLLFFARVAEIVIGASIFLFSNVDEQGGRDVEKISMHH